MFSDLLDFGQQILSFNILFSFNPCGDFPFVRKWTFDCFRVYGHGANIKLCYPITISSITQFPNRDLSIMSRASEAGSPTNRSGSDKTRASKHLTIGKLDNHLDKNLKKGTNRTFDSPFLLRQGEPGTSQYICQAHVFMTLICRKSNIIFVVYLVFYMKKGLKILIIFLIVLTRTEETLRPHGDHMSCTLQDTQFPTTRHNHPGYANLHEARACSGSR